ncbi:MAG TPA: hypothetical protein VGG48_07640 [Rhizomicrobium sp.]|jgi:hypothetical protein
MWDFSFSRSVGAILRTLPFIVLRLAVYLAIAVAYVFATGFGAGIGYGLGYLGHSPDAHATGAAWGGLIGFGVVSAALYLARQYLLYLVKAAHIAVLVEILDGKSIPNGQGQIAYGTNMVKTHFAETSVLFGVDLIIKGVLRAIMGMLNFFTAFLPIPALQTLVRLAEAVIRMSLTYVDEIILAYLLRIRTTNPWGDAKDALILYAQNYKHFLKNAVWLSLFMWGTTLVLFIVLLAPAGALAFIMPGAASWWVLVIALIFAVALKKAILEPLAIASLMQVYFKTIEGQKPDPEWDARLSSASSRFRELGEKAAGWIPRPHIDPTPGAAKP